MANIPFKSITFPGLPNKYTVPEISNDLMTAGKAADAKATGDALSALEDAITEETDKLKADLGYLDDNVNDSKSAIMHNIASVNAFNVVDNTSAVSRTNNGVTFTWNEEHTECVVSGTASGTASSLIYINRYEMPKGLVPGKTYRLIYNSSKVSFNPRYYVGEADAVSLGNFLTDAEITIPSNATGIYIRLSVQSGLTVNETVAAPILILSGIETNKELSDQSNYFYNSLMIYGVEDYVRKMNIFDSSHNGIEYTWTGNSCHVSGATESSMSWLTLFSSKNQLPYGFVPGKKYYVKYSGTNVRFRIYDYTGGTTSDILNTKHDASFTLPQSCTGVIIRLYVENNTSNVDEVVTPLIMSGYDIPELTGLADLSKTAILNKGAISAGVYNSCDDITTDGLYFISSSGGQLTVQDYPLSHPGWLVVYRTNPRIIFQIAYPYNSSDEISFRAKNESSWNTWKTFPEITTTTITQEVSRDTYENTYNISVSPQITTGSNGWLQPVDTNTADETGKTDMTSAIMAMLNSTGYCHLAPGIYYVSGNIDMPADSMIEGCGKQTIIRLLQTVTSGYIVRMHTRSTLKNVCLSGSYTDGSIADGNIGGRKGIQYIANRDGQDTGVTPTRCTICQIINCWFENLDSGFYGYNAGGGIQQGVEMSDCYFTHCKAGINIDYWTEYCKFTNIVTFQCYYGCINNGGNNIFTACTFHGVIGFLIDNSGSNKQNCGHGSLVGCTFNHIDNMNNPSELGKGIGIKILNNSLGFIIANCQLWYGRIHIEDSTGIQITGCEFGGLGGSSYPVIEASGTDPLFIDNCLFRTIPTFSVLSPVKMENCWTYDGTKVTIS
jgi:hypothetical protein